MGSCWFDQYKSPTFWGVSWSWCLYVNTTIDTFIFRWVWLVNSNRSIGKMSERSQHYFNRTLCRLAPESYTSFQQGLTAFLTAFLSFKVEFINPFTAFRAQSFPQRLLRNHFVCNFLIVLKVISLWIGHHKNRKLQEFYTQQPGDFQR